MSSHKRYVIIGGVASGASAATRLRRHDEHAEITIIERGGYVSFANCGIPYHLGRIIDKREKLIIRTPEDFWIRDRVKVKINTTATAINSDGKTVAIKDSQGKESEIAYDDLILAQGAAPFPPPIPGYDKDHVHTIRSIEDMDLIDQKIADAEEVVVIGGGFIGIEMAENLQHRGLDVTILEKAPRLLRPFEPMIAGRCQKVLEALMIEVVPDTDITEITDKEVKTKEDGEFPADLVLMAIGVKPDSALAESAGIKLGEKGGIQVDEYFATNLPHIYAVGDMIEVNHIAINQKMLVPLAGPANRQGRLVADNIAGQKRPYKGVIGSSVLKVGAFTAATTGITEELAEFLKIPVITSTYNGGQHASYYPGVEEVLLKIVFHRQTGKVLGASAFGKQDVEKRIDVVATSIAGGLTAQDLCDIDLCYAPPFNGPVDPVNRASYIAQNMLDNLTKYLPWEEVEMDKLLIDVREPAEFKHRHVPNAINIPLSQLRDRLDEIPKDEPVYLYCLSGLRAYLAERILIQGGWENLVNVTGGIYFYHN